MHTTLSHLPVVIIWGERIRYSDAIGNLLGLLGLYLSWKRSIYTWYTEIASALVLGYTYFHAHLLGGVGKQLVILIVSCYGFYAWNRTLKPKIDANPSPETRWATAKERVFIIVSLILGTVILAKIFQHYPNLSWNPWPDAYIFIASLLATIGLVYHLIEFWILWLAVDLVGVPLTYESHLIFSALVYVIYFILVITGLTSWIKISKAQQQTQMPPE